MIINLCLLACWEFNNLSCKVKASIAGQSHEFFPKLDIYESLIAILVYHIQTSKRTLLKSEKFVELEIKTSPRKKKFLY